MGTYVSTEHLIVPKEGESMSMSFEVTIHTAMALSRFFFQTIGTGAWMGTISNFTRILIYCHPYSLLICCLGEMNKHMGPMIFSIFASMSFLYFNQAKLYSKNYVISLVNCLFLLVINIVFLKSYTFLF
jgi:hypothetical protein